MCRSPQQTHHLIGPRQLALMKPTAFLINTSRGPVVDEGALVDALLQRRLAGAGLDVFEQEPVFHPSFRDLRQVVLLPHLGSATLATRVRMGMICLENVDAVLRRKVGAESGESHGSSSRVRLDTGALAVRRGGRTRQSSTTRSDRTSEADLDEESGLVAGEWQMIALTRKPDTFRIGATPLAPRVTKRFHSAGHVVERGNGLIHGQRSLAGTGLSRRAPPVHTVQVGHCPPGNANRR
jgi:hypothetical protein